MRILLIEDDRELCEAVSVALIGAGYAVDACYNGEDGLYYAQQRAHEVILLDRMLPGMDGLALLGALRRAGIATPVIMVTAMDGVGDRVDGLDAGADDYLVKPYAIEELLARIRALARRPQQYEKAGNPTLGDLELDPQLHLVTGPAGGCLLSQRESQLLEILLRNAGQILPRGLLLARVWGPDTQVEDGNLDNYIHFLRRRLRTVGSALIITTVRAVGYRLDLPEGRP